MYGILDSGVRRNDVSTDPSTVMPAKAGIQSLARDAAHPSENRSRNAGPATLILGRIVQA